MNGQFYKNTGYQEPLNLATAPIGNVDYEQSYIENILRQNKGKKAKAYFSFTDSNAWRDKVFEGVIEEAGKDHYLNYVEFDEAINYNKNYVDKY